MATAIINEQASDDGSVSLNSHHDEDGGGGTEASGNEGFMATVEDKLEAEWQRAARKESRAVAFSRGVVLLALVAAAASVTSNVGRYISRDQQDDFELSFDANAHKIIEVFHASIQRRLEAVDAISVDMTSFARSSGAEFPFVTLPDYAIRAANARVLSNSYVLIYFPLVSADQLEEWEVYSNTTGLEQFAKARQSDVAQRLAQDERFAAMKNQRSTTNRRFLQSTDGEAKIEPVWPVLGDDVLLPLWQESPVSGPFLINYNILAEPAAMGAYHAVLESKKATLAPADLNVGENERLANYLASIYAMSQYREVVEEVAFDPTSALAYPVFDSFDVETREVVGVFGMNINWRTIFQRVVASNVYGIYCVVDNSFNQTFTFRLDGGEAVFVGEGDFHDPDFDHMVQQSDVKSFLETASSPITQAYTSVDLDYDFCTFSLRVYPSTDTEAAYRNRDATVFVLVIIGVFVFTSLVFVAYDLLVARRQRNVMKRAVASSAIVSSLFPQQVREQLYQEAKVETGKENTEILHEDVKEGETAQDMMLRVTSGSSSRHSDLKARPIAHQFENTTVLFADLSGFTSWSAKHTPEQVFELLEALYAKFDATAKRRGVFKVETIGDCYLAVTGMPDPNPRHAITCALFASDILRHTQNVIHQLSDHLGKDTTKLQLRVGLHSGHITAGVLRGEKSRFQVFGDTVNTASRMESTGQAGRIQISEATAAEIRAKNKGHWLIAREDKIVAKGKGELQTFWLNVNSSGSSATSSCAYSVASADTFDDDDRVTAFEQSFNTGFDSAASVSQGEMTV